MHVPFHFVIFCHLKRLKLELDSRVCVYVCVCDFLFESFTYFSLCFHLLRKNHLWSHHVSIVYECEGFAFSRGFFLSLWSLSTSRTQANQCFPSFTCFSYEKNWYWNNILMRRRKTFFLLMWCMQFQFQLYGFKKIYFPLFIKFKIIIVMQSFFI